MWQPNRAQWSIIWTLAIVLVLAWPPAEGKSLGVKLLNWIVDPRDSLPTFPPVLPFGLDDNGDAVAEHDALEQEYYRRYSESSWTRWRMEMKEWSDPFEPATERQVLVGLLVFGALGVWRLNAPRT
jgi:hypothetical protein